MNKLILNCFKFLRLIIFVALTNFLSVSYANSQNSDEEWNLIMKAAGIAYGVAQTELALENYFKALEIADLNFSDDDPRLFTTLLVLGPTLHAVGRSKEAAIVMERGLALHISLYGENNSELMHQYPILAGIHLAEKNYDRAEELYLNAISIMSDSIGNLHPRTVTLREYLATMLFDSGKTDEALELFSEVVLEWELALGPNHIRQSVSYAGYAQMLNAVGRTEESTEAFRTARKINAAWEAAR